MEVTMSRDRARAVEELWTEYLHSALRWRMRKVEAAARSAPRPFVLHVRWALLALSARVLLRERHYCLAVRVQRSSRLPKCPKEPD